MAEIDLSVSGRGSFTQGAGNRDTAYANVRGYGLIAQAVGYDASWIAIPRDAWSADWMACADGRTCHVTVPTILLRRTRGDPTVVPVHL